MLILSFLPNTFISLFSIMLVSSKNYQYKEIKEKNETNEIILTFLQKLLLLKGQTLLKMKIKIFLMI